MALTQNTYTGNGSTVLFSFTFPYLATTDIKVSVNGTNTTAYTLANATTIQFTTAPVNGAAIRIYRITDNSLSKATFFPGSAIRSNDLNDNFTQSLYVTQEANNFSADANALATSVSGIANTALTQSSSAVAASTSATSTANTALSNSSAAVTTANAASVTATSANNTANLALSGANNSLNYTLVATVATIPTSPTNDKYIEIIDSTGVESFTPLAGLPGGFVGSSSLTVRLRYTTAGSTWNFYSYYANNPETRYLKFGGGTMTGPLTLSGAPTTNLQPATKAYVDVMQPKAGLNKDYAGVAQAYFFGSF